MIENRNIHSYNVDVFITREKKVYKVPILNGLEIKWERKGVPGQCTFSIIQEDTEEKVEFEEGDEVQVRISKTWMFKGYIFTKTRNKDGVVKYTCFDQLRYLKAKEAVNFVDKTVGEIVNQICDERELKKGTIRDSEKKYKIPSITRDNISFHDVILTAIEKTTEATGEIFILYDRFGKITLCPLKHMKRNVVIDSSVIGDFEYESTIDKQTYNVVRVAAKSKKDGATVYYTARDQKNVNKWGVLQLTEKSSNSFTSTSAAKQLLDFYNSKTKTLKIKNAMGAVEVVAGAVIIVNLDLGDMKLTRNMVVDAVTHRVEDGLYSMDLELIGGEFVSTRGVQGEQEEKHEEVSAGENENSFSSEVKYTGGSITYSSGGHKVTLSESLVNQILKQCIRYKIMPSFILTQMWAESFWGDSNVGRKNNNWGGITWPYKGDPSVKKYKGIRRPAAEGGYYVRWNSAEDYIVDHFFLFREGGYYKVRYKTTIGGFINGLLTRSRGGEAKANYAASPNYRSLMNSTYNRLMKHLESKLKQLDKMVYENGTWKSGTVVKPNNAVGSNISNSGNIAHVKEAQKHIGKSWAQMNKLGHMTRGLWCADFTVFCMKKAGNLPVGATSSTRDLFSKYRARGKAKHLEAARNYTPKSGDIIFFYNGSGRAGALKIDHVGIVEKVEGTKITTIEGNSGARLNVGRHTYWVGQKKITGYGIM